MARVVAPLLHNLRSARLGPPNRCSCSSVFVTASAWTSTPTTAPRRQAHAIHTGINRAQQEQEQQHFPTHSSSSSSNSSSSSSSRSSTADQKEIEHFGALASTWWDAHGPSRLLHLMNPVRIAFIQRCLLRGQPLPQQEEFDFLDVGCGGGILAESLARLPIARSVTGVDPSPEIVRVAKEHARRDPLFLCGDAAAAVHGARKKQKLRYLCGTVDELGSGSVSVTGGHQDEEGGGGGDKYDVVTAMEVLEHVCSPQRFLAQCAARVRPGGWLVVSTIARHPVSWVTTKLLAEGVLRIVPWGTHDWSRYVNADELTEWVGRWGVQGGSGAGGAGGAGAGADGLGAEDGARWDVADTVVMGCVYVPGLGWKEAPPGAEKVGNYFFAVRRAPRERE